MVASTWNSHPLTRRDSLDIQSWRCGLGWQLVRCSLQPVDLGEELPEHDAAVPTDSRYSAVAEHVARYVETNGEIGHIWRDVPTLVLTTRGRRSGTLRRTALIYARTESGLVVAASNLGSDRHPDWYLNLLAEPKVTVQVKDERFDVIASVASGPEHDALWDVMVGVWPDYEDYQRKTQRRIPLVVLSAATEDAPASSRS